mmetsp:Transcript_71304/g.158496  ORF Transcript_71304/g.158496 Transcript_71304/m.158496 type:complete len:94 (+) Transcript_71304:2263-2544(+)
MREFGSTHTLEGKLNVGSTHACAPCTPRSRACIPAFQSMPQHAAESAVIAACYAEVTESALRSMVAIALGTVITQQLCQMARLYPHAERHSQI